MKIRYSQKVKDFIGKVTGYKIMAMVLGYLVFEAMYAVVKVVLIGFVIYTNNSYLLTPEAIPSQVTPEEPQVSIEIHVTI